MFFKMVRGVLFRQKGKMVMIALTIALGASLATAMLNVMFDVGDKVNQELKTYGANITVVPKSTSVINDLYDVEGGTDLSTAYLREDELGNIKTIFWAFNIVDFAPMTQAKVAVNGSDATIVGSWFNHHLSLPTGEELDAGIASLRSWWDVTDGEWVDEQSADGATSAMVGTRLAEKLGVKAGDTLEVRGTEGNSSKE